MIRLRNTWCLKFLTILMLNCSLDATNKIQHDQQTEKIQSTENNDFNLIPVDEFSEYNTSNDTQYTPDSQASAHTTKVESEADEFISQAEPRRVNKILVTGNKFISQDAILNYVPYKKGEVYDPNKSRQLIRNLYFSLKRFRNITLKGENVGTDQINLHIIVEEKTPLKEIIIKNNTTVSNAEIRKKVSLDLPAADKEELQALANKIKRLYIERGYFLVDIKVTLEKDSDGHGTATFTVKEGKKALVKQIHFTGNQHISDKELRGVLFTREDWVLSFLDKSGTYHPDRLEGDKAMLEQHYQNNGFLHAKITDIDVQMNSDQTNITLIFDIEEGNQYTFGEIHAPGNELLSEAFLLSGIPLWPGQIYSRERIGNAIKRLEQLWGSYGYIFANISPSVEIDEESKTINVTFNTDLGNKIKLNKINIKGNRKTRDKVIRRRMTLLEDEYITNQNMEISKNNVESLGFFEPRDGVNWKINRINDEYADLDLFVNEAKTGSFNAQTGFGGSGFDIRSPKSGFNFKAGIADTNLFGSEIHFNVDASWAQNEQTILFHLSQPWLFNQPISGAFDFYHKRPTYDELRNISPRAINEKLTGGSVTAGVITHYASEFLNGTSIIGSLGIDDIRYEKRPVASLLEDLGAQAAVDYQGILNNEFTPGKFLWLANGFEQDKRNHPIHTSRGHKWKILSKIAIPTFGDNIGFYKFTLDANWYTPLIGERDLVFRVRGFAGLIAQFNNHVIPFGELFHIGGPASVRGFLFGQIGPKFACDSIGAKKALFWNAELVFPITPDFTMKGVVFYDGGAGFDNPNAQNISRNILTNNNFDYRHSVGFGVRLLQPMPVRIDWGFKIDPRINKANRDKDESSYEIHFSMNYDWW